MIFWSTREERVLQPEHEQEGQLEGVSDYYAPFRHKTGVNIGCVQPGADLRA
jgi:hypothetical protein